MDNPLTPNKIQRLIHLAEDRSFNIPRRLLLNDEDLKRLTSSQASSTSNPNYEASSGLLDLDKVEGFGDSGVGNISLSKSTAFNPGEMTGRSTGTEEVNSKSMGMNSSRNFEDFGRHSLVLDSITSQMDKQTSEVNDIMRHSIATNYSFHYKNLTADEASLVLREAPLPVPPGTQTNFADTTTLNNSNASVGAYFKNKCIDFGQILGKTDSPDRSLAASITEVSAYSSNFDYAGKDVNLYKMDQSLDCVPVKQPRNPVPTADKPIVNNLVANEKQNICDTTGKADHFSGKLTAKIEKPTFSKEVYKASSNTPNPVRSTQKSFMNTTSSKPTDVLLRNLQSSMRLITDDTEGSAENSFSLSKIADYLGNQSNISVTDMLQMHKKASSRKPPLTELQMNTQERVPTHSIQVTTLKDSKNMVTASSAGSVDTVISLDKLRIQKENAKEVPAVIVTNIPDNNVLFDDADNVNVRQRSTRSKSPSSKSQSTLSTVQENFASFKSGDSPLQNSRGEANTSHVPSPNIEYKELDKSVDWHEVLQQKQMEQEGLAKVSEKWVEISTTAANGFVGVNCPVTLTVTTLTDSWLTAKFQFDSLPNNGHDLTVELPRLPILLSPGKTDQFTLHLTSTVEMSTSLKFTMTLRDASIDGDIEQKGEIDVNFIMPKIQAMSCDGINKISFQPVVEKAYVTKSFVLLSDSAVDLQLDLSISEGGNLFFIKNAQEVKKSDINKVLMERQGSAEEQPSKGKQKAMNKQLCRLSSGNGIKVTVAFSAPKLAELQIKDQIASFNGVLDVCLMGIKTVLRKVDLVSIVGTVNLVADIPGKKLRLTNESTSVTLLNNGTIPGVWASYFKASNQTVPIKISPTKFEIKPGVPIKINLAYSCFEDDYCETSIIFEELSSGIKTVIDVIAGKEKTKSFPIKTNYNILSWIRGGRKELSLKNSSNSKVHVKCQIIGSGFSIDLPGVESRGTYLLPFGPNECRTLPIIFNPNTFTPLAATLHIVYDKTSDSSRKVKLFGCASGEIMRWSGLVTYGDTALVRAVSRAPIELNLYNKSPMPAFVCAKVRFNLQYISVSSTATVSGGSHVVGGRSRHTVRLAVDWVRVERRARDAPASTALATITVLTGAEFTRRRILKILRDESQGDLDTSLLPEHLKVLTDALEGEDKSMDSRLIDFQENKASLNELFGGLQELTAQIDLPQDFSDEHTIIITDDTVIEHHTLCD